MTDSTAWLTTKSRIAVALLISLLASTPSAAGLILVPEEAGTIAQGLAAASQGDTVSLATGTYNEHDLVLPPGVSLIGRAMNPDLCTIDGQSLGRVLYGEDLTRENVIQGLTLKRGASWLSEPAGYGGGFTGFGDPIFRSVRICDSVGGLGGGLYCAGRIIIEDCEFLDNEAHHGGGVRIDIGFDPTELKMEMRDVLIARNQAIYGQGGGIDITGRGGVIERALIHNNIAEGGGGGVSVIYPFLGAITLEIKDSTIIGNSASLGGGVFAHATIELINCTIVGNSANAFVGGGGFRSESEYSLQSRPKLTNCLIAFNLSGGGVSLYDWPDIDLECCDVYGNEPGNYVGWMYDHTGEDGNISADPRFCGGNGKHEYFIAKSSPCSPLGNECQLLIGAFPLGCEETAVAPSSWSAIKRLY